MVALAGCGSARSRLPHPSRPRLPARLLLPTALLAALALLPTPASAQGDFLLEASYEVELEVPMDGMEEVYNGTGPDVPDGTPLVTCGTSHFTFNAEEGWFRFQEGSGENACGEARYTVSMPEGTQRAKVSFRADRAIQQPSTLDLPKNMAQELRVYGQGGQQAAAFPYFDPSAVAQNTPSDFSYEVEAPPGERELTLGWYFFDEGETLGAPTSNPLAGQAFSATVADVRVTLSGIPIQGAKVSQERLGLQGDGVRYATNVELPVPESLGGPGGVSVRVRVPSDLSFSHAEAPDGEPIPDGHLETSELQGVREVLLTAEATALHGPGDYRIVFTSTTPLTPSPALYPFIVAILFVPVAAGAVSLRSARDLRRHASGGLASTARFLHNLVVTLLAAYLVVPIMVLVSGRLPLLSSWPLEGEAGLVYLLIGLSFVAFVIIGLLERRHLSGLMTQELELKEHARRELERSNRELEEFAYVASHDLQEPLRAVASYTQLLQRRYKGKLDADADTYIGAAVEGAHRMQALIQDLLAYSRVGSKPEPLVPVDLEAVARQVAGTFAPSLESSGGQVKVGELPTVVGSERQFTQLLQNLIGNALKFRHPDRPPRVEVRAARQGTGWRFEVQDNGIGIEPQHFGRIFQIFQRLHARNEYPGTGIGLAVCKRIVELRGGSIGVESVPGEGSTFWFTVPESPPLGTAARFLGSGAASPA